jgi:hypothetical protein
MATQLKILFVVAETWPLVKTGGLADVVPALARALAEQGHDVRLLMPGYRQVEETFAGRPAGRFFDVLPGLDRARLIRGELPDYGIPTWLLTVPGCTTVPAAPTATSTAMTGRTTACASACCARWPPCSLQAGASTAGKPTSCTVTTGMPG